MTLMATEPTRPPPAQPGSPPRSRWNPLSASVLATGLLVLGFGGYVTVISGVRADRDQRTLYATFRDQVRRATVPTTEPIAAGAPVALLEIPRLALTQVVVEGTSAERLARGPGHRADTVLPGQAGVSVLLGHRHLYGGPFASLDRLRAGDPITVTTGQGTFHYLVDGVHRAGQRPLTLPPAAASLLLETGGASWTTGGTLEVAAALSGTPLAAVVDRPPAVASSDLARHGDTDALVPLLLWSQALLLLGLGSAALWLRVPHAALWLVAAPLIALVLLHVYAAAAALLPNTL